MIHHPTGGEYGDLRSSGARWQAHLIWDQEAAGSNPVCSTTRVSPPWHFRFLLGRIGLKRRSVLGGIEQGGMNEMQFTPQEMASLYRQAKDKRQQIRVFMDCNCQTEAEVRASLVEGGIKQQQLPRGPSPQARKKKTVPEYE